MDKDGVINEYFNWLCDLVCKKKFSETVSYRKLLMYLHDKEFTYVIKKDKNRAADGVDLRYRFALGGYDYGYISECLDGPCSVLEMIVALAIRCEETIMDDPLVGDRTSQWFWGMITNIGLGYMNDKRFDKNVADDIIHKFLNREYSSNGRGGLFTIRNCDEDLRDIEIWTQMCHYLSSFS